MYLTKLVKEWLSEPNIIGRNKTMCLDTSEALVETNKGSEATKLNYADCIGSLSDMKNTLGGIFGVGSTIVSWYNRKHKELNSAKSECMPMSEATCEAI